MLEEILGVWVSLAAPFLGPPLAEFDIQVVTYLDKLGPKFGVTARHVLEAACEPAGAPIETCPVKVANGQVWVEVWRLGFRIQGMSGREIFP
jgi:hypothetical protein